MASGNVVSGTGGVTIAGFKAAYDQWHNLAIQAVDSKVTAYLDGAMLATYTDPNPRLSGRVDLASGYYYTRFDNLKVGDRRRFPRLLLRAARRSGDDGPLADPATKLVYGGAWAHENGKGMYDYQRSLSTSQGTGATLKYTFTGTGLDILGPTTARRSCEVTVDGQVVNSSASTMASKELYQTFTLRGLGSGPHTVQLKVLSGTLVVDAVGVVP